LALVIADLAEEEFVLSRLFGVSHALEDFKVDLFIELLDLPL